ncbi:hypothetical protein [Bacillus phage vB_BanS-Thrax5]|nr:hypothetical protein [Bacillus phage vB_BanS-Thrax5]
MHERVGETSISNEGYKMTIVEYYTNRKVIVEFENGYRTHAQYAQFQDGRLKNPYHKSVYGVGYFGEGKHVGLIGRKKSHKYQIWSSMMMRCYDSRFHEIQPTYIGCTVHEDWHNYNVFGDWYDENIYNIDGEKMALDKDIARKGNKIYSPDTCIFVPIRINNLFANKVPEKSLYPIGVTRIRNKFLAQCQFNGKKHHLGYYDTPEEAFVVYKQFKENAIKDVANEYMGKIPLKLYYAMMTYEVEITD